MKKIFIFIAGFFLAFLIVVAGIFIYIGQDNSEKPADSYADVITKKNLVSFSGEINLSPNLALRGDTSKGVLEVFLISKPRGPEENWHSIPLSHRKIAAPKFPVKVQIKVLAESLIYPQPNNYLVLNVHYSTAGQDVNNDYWSIRNRSRKTDLVYGSKEVLFSPEQMLNGVFPAEYDLGTITIGMVFPPLPQTDCISNKFLLAGKITPWQSSQDWGKKRIAMIAFPATHVDKTDKISAKEFDESVFHYQLLDFTHGIATFSIPAVKRPNIIPFIRLAAVACEEKEELKECAMRAFPMDRRVKKRVRIFQKNLMLPVCGTTNYDGFITENFADFYNSKTKN